MLSRLLLCFAVVTTVYAAGTYHYECYDYDWDNGLCDCDCKFYSWQDWKYYADIDCGKPTNDTIDPLKFYCNKAVENNWVYTYDGWYSLGDMWCDYSIGLCTPVSCTPKCGNGFQCQRDQLAAFGVSDALCIPAGWTNCAQKFYGRRDGCHCGCGALDSDCEVAGQDLYCSPLAGNAGSKEPTGRKFCDAATLSCKDVVCDPACKTGETCRRVTPNSPVGECVLASWSCTGSWYGGNDGCHCGCDVLDPDCNNANATIWIGPSVGNRGTNDTARTKYCSTTTLSATSVVCTPACPSDLQCKRVSPLNSSGICVRPSWNCATPSFNSSNRCDCGCGAYDPDCYKSNQELWCMTSAFVGAPDTTGSKYCNTSTLVCQDVVCSNCGEGETCQRVSLSNKNGQCVNSNFTCPTSKYNSNDGCHCGCNVLDPDCSKTLDKLYCDGTEDTSRGKYCDNNAACDTVLCDPPCTGGDVCRRIHLRNPAGKCVPPSWKCNVTNYYNNDGCQCGCGAIDPDCETSGAKLYCGATANSAGTEDVAQASYCNGTACVAKVCNPACISPETCTRVTPLSPGKCINPAWSCRGQDYRDGNCNCGKCGVADVDCTTPSVALYCDTSTYIQGYLDGSEVSFCNGTNTCSSFGPANCDPPCVNGQTCKRVWPNSGVGRCVPNSWSCMPVLYNDGFCDCGCGVLDIDCSTSSIMYCGSTLTTHGSNDTEISRYCDNTLKCAAVTCDPPCGGSQICRRLSTTSPIGKCVHPAWNCNYTYYNAGDGCHCGCGVLDPDCASPVQDLYCGTNGSNAGTMDTSYDKYCSASLTCATTTCSPSCSAGDACRRYFPNNSTGKCVPTGWTCPALYYSDGSICHCGSSCGVMDPDCTLADKHLYCDLSYNSEGVMDFDSVKYCNSSSMCDYVSCSTNCSANSQICMRLTGDSVTGKCSAGAWSCSTSFFDSRDGCNAGCTVLDPDCNVLGQAVYCNAHQSYRGDLDTNGTKYVDSSTLACMAIPPCDPPCGEGFQCRRSAVPTNSIVMCVPNNWTCLALHYNSSDGCHCECGTADPDCGKEAQTLIGCNSTDTNYCNNRGRCACKPGAFTRSGDVRICETCVANAICPGDSAAPACLEGFYRAIPNRGEPCLPCMENAYCRGGEFFVDMPMCLPGAYTEQVDVRPKTCYLCNDSYVCPGGNAKPSCANGSFTRDPTAEYKVCESCIPYATCAGGDAPPICDVGSFTFDLGMNNKTCHPCDGNYTCPGGDALHDCAPGAYTIQVGVPFKECLPCIENATCPGGDAAPICVEQCWTMQPAENNKICLACNVSHSCIGGDSTPECAYGYYTHTPEERYKECLPCMKNATCLGGAAIPQCVAGTYTHTPNDIDKVCIECTEQYTCAGFASIPLCAANYFTLQPGDINKTCEPCIPFANCSGGDTVPRCMVGAFTFTPGLANKSCEMCDTSLYVCAGTDDERLCAVNAYTMTPGLRNRTCILCNTTDYVCPGNDSIPECNVGTYTLDEYEKRDKFCERCDETLYVCPGNMTIRTCQVGAFTFTPGLANKTCEICNSSKYYCDGGDLGRECKPGHHTLTPGARDKICEWCDPSLYVCAGNDTVRTCAPGAWTNTTDPATVGMNCTACSFEYLCDGGVRDRQCANNTFTLDVDAPQSHWKLCTVCDDSLYVCPGNNTIRTCVVDAFTKQPGQRDKVCVFCDTTVYECRGADAIPMCLPGYYTPTPSNPYKTCYECLTGARCPGGNEKPIALPGYHVSAQDDYQVLPCSPAWACKGEDKCAYSYTGYMCASCDIGFFKDDDGQCRSCSADQAATIYGLAVFILLIPFMILAWSVDGGVHDARFGLASIIIAWCQYTALFKKLQIDWTTITPGGKLLEYLDIFTSWTLVDTRPECALSVKYDNFALNLVTTMIPFIMSTLIVFYYTFILFWSKVLSGIGRRPLTVSQSEHKAGYGILLNALHRPLRPDTRVRVRWGMVRAIVTTVTLTALPSLIGLLTIFDCTRYGTPDGYIWLSDVSRDKECFTGTYYWGFASVHITVMLIWALLLWTYVRKSRDATETEGQDVGEEYARASMFGGTFVKFRLVFKYYNMVDLLKKLCFASAITFTNTRPLIQIICTSFVLLMFGATTLIIGPYRSEMCNISEGYLSVLAGITIASGYNYQNTDTIQTWWLFILLSIQITIVVLSFFTEMYRRNRFMRHHKRIVADTRALVEERTVTLSSANDTLRHLREHILEKIGNKQLTRKILDYLLEPQPTPKLSYDQNREYEHVLRLFSDGGPWRRIHTLAISDPDSSLLRSFIENFEKVGNYVDQGAIVKLAGIFLTSKNMEYAGTLMTVLRGDTVIVNEAYMAILLSYCTASLAVLQQDMKSSVDDDSKAAPIHREVKFVRNMMVNALERYHDYSSRLAVLRLRLPGKSWRIGDALIGVDHMYMLNRVEDSPTKELIMHRLLLRKVELHHVKVDDKELQQLTMSTV